MALSAWLKISSWASALLLSSNEDNEMTRSVFSKGNLDLRFCLLLDTTKKAGENDGENMANEDSALRQL